MAMWRASWLCGGRRGYVEVVVASTGLLSLLVQLVWTTNAKSIGVIYLVLSLCFGVSGLLLSWLLRGEIGGLGEQVLFGDHQLYNVLITTLRAIAGHARECITSLLPTEHSIVLCASSL